MHTRLLVALATLFGAVPAIALQPVNLRCEGLTNPVAIQIEKPSLSWTFEAGASPGAAQSAYRILVASSRKALDTNRGDVWDTGKVESRATIQIPYGGPAPGSGIEYFWKVQVWDQAGKASAWSPTATWRFGLHPQDWNAKWIGGQPDGETPAARMPVFRRAVRIDKPVESAIAYISGLGQYELRINGTKIGDAVLQPGWTNYRKTVFYNAYDVTKALKIGDNAVGVMLGNGFFHVPKVADRYTKLVETFGQPKLIARIHIVFADGGTADVTSDASWEFTPGPIVFSHVYGGEDYDARLDPAGWDQAAFDDHKWKTAVEVAGPGGRLVAQTNPDIRVMQTFRTQKVTEPKPGIRVYDLGQNFSGWPRITVRGPAGATVKMIPAELLAADGLVSQENSGAPQWFSYTLKGSGEETWSPRFSYYGFRYLQVEGATGTLELKSVEGEFVHSSAPVVGEFSCSNELFNRIHKLIDLAILSNMQSVLTDCPHREKLGWLEQSYLLGSAVMYNYGVEGLYQKISEDMADAQRPDGLVPDIAPEYTVFEDGFVDSPEWGSAVVLDPWLAYKHFGTRRSLAAHYDDMKRYVEYLDSKSNGGIVSHGLGDWYDIGPKFPGVSQLTSLGVTATAIYYADIVLVRDAALMLNKAADAERLTKQAESVRAAFNAKFYNPATGVYDRGSQTAYAMPLAVGLVPQQRRGDALKMLVEDIREHRNHTTAGDIGFHFVLQALGEAGRSDVIYDMLVNPDPPSYAAQLRGGATTLTEAWDSNPKVSQNHFMLGHAEEWFYRYLAGIDFDLSRAPEEQIVLRPTPVGDVTSAHASYESPLGRIVSSWSRSGWKFVYDLEIPPNTTAKVVLPSAAGARTERVKSGRHHFETQQ